MDLQATAGALVMRCAGANGEKTAGQSFHAISRIVFCDAGALPRPGRWLLSQQPDPNDR